MTFPLQLDWRRGQDMPFAMCNYIQAVEVEGTVYVGGGLADKTNNMYIVMAYDTQSCKWHTLPPYSAKWFTMTTIHNKLVLVGGRHNFDVVNQLGVWQTDSNKWTLPFSPMPTPRHSPSATSYKHWLVVAGGYTFTILSNVGVLNVDNNQWSTGPSTPTPWHSMKSTTIGDTWYLMGGYDASATGGYYISLEALVSHSVKDSSNIWRKLPSPNYSYSCPLNIEGSLLAFGGWDREKKCGMSTIQRYVPEINTWVATGELPHALYDCTCIMTSGKLYVIGGRDTKTSFKSTYMTDI